MHRIVKSFRDNFVEGRFVIPLTSLFVVGMRIMLYLKRGFPIIKSSTSNFIWTPIAPFFEKPLISLFASTLLVFVISWIFFFINNRYSIIRSRTNLPFVTSLFLLSLHPYCLVMTGDYIAIVFILLAFIPLLDSYQMPNSYLYSFRSSILIGVASLFQVFALIFIPLWWRGERSMRGPQLRSVVASIFGVLLVYISLFSVYFVFDDIYGFLLPFSNFATISLPVIPDYSIFEWIAFLLVVFFFIINLIISIKEYSRDKVLTVSLMQFIVYLIIILLLLQILYWQETLFYLILSATLISFVCSYFYSKTTVKTDIFLAYTMLFLIILFYLSQYFPETYLKT